MFTEREYNKLIDFSDLFILDVPTGTITITDYLFNEPAAKIEILPGQYRVSLYFDDKGTYFICLARLMPEINLIENKVSIPQLEG
ncbi:hypothetical protein [Legionella drancourtii]|uniref:Uncharacterized protein n=1 Tax=Legionella drancourtii LLAP12 TaxID=658187 RepID=G9ENU1_9GAMM|nr:hypothetical protein [Legionella drancourtii]EHL31013.1 hypothetical protein LDG_6919 [Legionella drancourtii LLAP12]